MSSEIENRQWQRRRRHVPVDVSGPEKTYQGWVVDSSPGGLCLVVNEEIPNGTPLAIRPRSEYPITVFVKVINQRLHEEKTELGCEFVSSPSWDALLQFS